MRRAREEEAQRGDLEVLDPTTGEAVDAGTAATGVPRPHPPAGALRLRRLAVVLTVLSVVAAGAAAHRAAALASLQALNRSWAEAMALDAARQQADGEVRQLRPDVRGPQEPDRRAAMTAIGEEAAAGLLAIERDVRGQWILDRAVDRLRDQMVEALRFRRFQMSPERELLGSTPLRRVDAALEEQLARWRLERATARPPELRSVGPAVAPLRRFAATETRTLLVASAGRRLLHIDVDASAIEDRTLPRPPTRLIVVDDLLVVADGAAVTAYPRDPDRPALWTVEAADAVAGRPGGHVAVWASTDEGLRAVARDGTVASSTVGIAPGAVLLADTDAGLLVGAGGSLDLIDPTSGRVARTLATAGRFAGASPGFVAVQATGRPVLVIHRLADGTSFELALPRTDAGHVVPSPEGDVFAFAAGPLAGNIASVLRLELDGPAWSLVGIGGPRGTVAEGTLTWSPSGRQLFWLTPDGEIALAEGTDTTLLRAPVRDLDRLVALPDRR